MLYHMNGCLFFVWNTFNSKVQLFLLKIWSMYCTLYPEKIVQKKSENHFGLTYLNGPLSGLNFEIAQSLNLLRNFS